MQTQDSAPWLWIQRVITGLQWPVIVVSAFLLGRYVQKLEERLIKTENRLTALMERHMPAIHNALAEIRGCLIGRN